MSVIETEKEGRRITCVRDVTAMDVLSGNRAKKLKEHPGNKIFMHFLKTNLQNYVAAPTKTEKSMEILSIVKAIHSQGGRFLKIRETSHLKRPPNEREWLVMNQREVTDKISHALRAETKKVRGKQLKQKVATKKQRRDKPGEAKSKKMIIPRNIPTSFTNKEVKEKLQVTKKQPQFEQPKPEETKSKNDVSSLYIPPAYADRRFLLGLF
mmetsp:Transcript_34383/g.51036  ORF Transcript_34383/g.51036 Transcript_34383/m.51036 type:complete len:210 (-) Transcript_34383:358-987(-)|eukprot:CAMPEP_0194049422 /NCGR_PEP_ID=MMETSP0009_2-20130614/30669_1 /TAXON_ID=210454 /ORGANISM="Grammatophora oceanica, Strain CCMP 410" /LENGTH=209 /DNA_ID=CAMNT_0038695583 /DNA_START=197 /DNA_END=826 /DNA_ORIENTATION=+